MPEIEIGINQCVKYVVGIYGMVAGMGNGHRPSDQILFFSPSVLEQFAPQIIHGKHGSESSVGYPWMNKNQLFRGMGSCCARHRLSWRRRNVELEMESV